VCNLWCAKIGGCGNNNLTFGDGCVALVSSIKRVKMNLAKLCESRVEGHLVIQDVIPFVCCISLEGILKCPQGFLECGISTQRLSNIIFVLLWPIPKQRKEKKMNSLYHQHEFEHVCLREQVRSSVRKKCDGYTKTITFLVKILEVVAHCCLNWKFSS
jgi:hypothetical protein